MCDDAVVGPFRQLSIAVLLAVLTASPGLSCSTSFVGVVDVGPNFRIEAKDRSRLVEGVPVKLHVGLEVKYEAVTDKDGIAQFHNVPPGSYFLIAGPEPGFAHAFNLQVNPEELSERTIPVRWPNATVLATASLKGILRLPDGIQGQEGSASLEVLEPLSGRTLKRADIGLSGSFDFPGLAPGLYVLRLTPLTPIVGLIPVDVQPSAAKDRLDLDLGFDSCGMRYMDHNQCPELDLHLRRLQGRTVDGIEAGFPNAEVTLLGTDGKLVGRTYTDRTGNFSLDAPDGTYRLVVGMNDETPLRGTVTIDPNGASSLLQVHLGLLGTCSSATTR